MTEGGAFVLYVGVLQQSPCPLLLRIKSDMPACKGTWHTTGCTASRCGTCQLYRLTDNWLCYQSSRVAGMSKASLGVCPTADCTLELTGVLLTMSVKAMCAAVCNFPAWCLCGI